MIDQDLLRHLSRESRKDREQQPAAPLTIGAAPDVPLNIVNEPSGNSESSLTPGAANVTEPLCRSSWLEAPSFIVGIAGLNHTACASLSSTAAMLITLGACVSSSVRALLAGKKVAAS